MSFHSQPIRSPQLPEPSLAQVRRISRVMVWVCRVLVVGLPLSLGLYWAFTGQEDLIASSDLRATVVVGSLQVWQRVAAGLAMALPLSLLLIGLWQAQRCFTRFAHGEVFTSVTTALLRSFAGWVAGAALAAIVASSVVSVVLTLNNPAGMRELVVSFGSNELFTLFFAAMVWLMAAVIGQGQALADENQTFV